MVRLGVITAIVILVVIVSFIVLFAHDTYVYTAEIRVDLDKHQIDFWNKKTCEEHEEYFKTFDGYFLIKPDPRKVKIYNEKCLENFYDRITKDVKP